MPTFRERLSDEQARALMAVVRAFGPARAPTVDAGADDFDARFRKLEQDLAELKRQFRELARPRRAARPERVRP
jgi:hypothetical protein